MVRSVPAEIGDLSELRELMLNNNLLRTIPPEIGKLFQLLVRYCFHSISNILRCRSCKPSAK